MVQYHLVDLLQNPCHGKKRSVFAHNRRQEELSKLTAPGLVVQKKAFFEEYYKRVRHLKAQRTVHQTEATLEERSNENTLVHNSEADQLPAIISDDSMASALSSSFEPSTAVSSSDERKCQDAHELGYLTFNPLFSQTTGLQNIQHEESSSSDQKQYLDREFPCTAHSSSNHALRCEAIERKVLAPRLVSSNDNGASNVAGSRIVLPRASLQSEGEGLKVDCEKLGPRKNVTNINRSMKTSKEQSTSVIHIPRVNLRRNSENRPSQDLTDSFHTRVQMKLRALSDRMNADRTAASSRSASYQPPDRAMTSCKSSYQNADRLATSSTSSLWQNMDRVLAPSKSAAQVSHKSPKGLQREDALPRNFFTKGSCASHVASTNGTATGKSAAKILVMPSSSQVSAKTSRTAQVTLKRTAVLTSVNDGSQNKRKKLSTPAALDENNLKRGYVRKSAPPSSRSSSENLPPAAKAPKISNMTNMAKIKWYLIVD